MEIEPGDILVHEQSGGEISVWRIMPEGTKPDETPRPEDDVVMGHITSSNLGENTVPVGFRRSFRSASYSDGRWKKIAEEDIPLVLLGNF